jgi:hypothetical protein
VWVATSTEHHKSLKKELPSLCSIPIYSDKIKESEWRLLPDNADDFESSVIKVCDLIKHSDQRIGRIPKLSKSKAKKSGQ